MRKSRAAVLIFTFPLVIALTFSPSASTPLKGCGCSAPDGSCSVSASCSGGCIATCPPDGCSAQCSGYYSFLETEVTFRMENGTNSQLLAALANASGKDVAFSPLKPDVAFNLDIKGADLWDVLDLLSNNGTVEVAGQDFEKLKRLRRAFLSGERMSLCVQNTPVGTFVRDLSNLTGLPIRVTGGSAKATVNVRLQNVTLEEILVQVSEQTGTRITDESVESVDSDAR